VTLKVIFDGKKYPRLYGIKSTVWKGLLKTNDKKEQNYDN
jgi:hypothetical protein